MITPHVPSTASKHTSECSLDPTTTTTHPARCRRRPHIHTHTTTTTTATQLHCVKGERGSFACLVIPHFGSGDDQERCKHHENGDAVPKRSGTARQHTQHGFFVRRGHGSNSFFVGLSRQRLEITRAPTAIKPDRSPRPSTNTHKLGIVRDSIPALHRAKTGWVVACVFTYTSHQLHLRFVSGKRSMPKLVAQQQVPARSFHGHHHHTHARVHRLQRAHDLVPAGMRGATLDVPSREV